MSFSLLPTWTAEALPAVTPTQLKRKGIRLLMLDFDNTIVPYTTDVPTEEMVHWLDSMAQSGIRLCVVSNSRNERVQRFCGAYDLPCITRAGKPGTRGIRECLETYGVPRENAALVGDQIYTDTLAANLADVNAILVPAIDNHNFWLKARHVLELPFIYATKKRRLES